MECELASVFVSFIYIPLSVLHTNRNFERNPKILLSLRLR